MIKRVALVIAELEVGGTQRQMLELAKGLDRRRYQPELWCLSGVLTFAPEFERAGIPVVKVRKRSRFDLSTLLRLRRSFRERLIDVVMTFGFTADLWACTAAKFAGVKLVISSVRTSREESRSVETISGLITLLADHFISNSCAAAVQLQRRGVSPRRITVIPNGIDINRFIGLPDRLSVRAKLAIPHDAFVVGTVCRLSPEKNLGLLLRIARATAGMLPNCRFVVIGDGPEKARLRQMSRDLGVDERVVWTGERNDVPSLLPAFDLGMLTSEREGISNVLLEFMAAGVPVVATAVGGNPEVIVDGRTGLLFPHDDVAAATECLGAIARDVALRAQMGSAAMERVRQQYSISALVSATEDLIDSLLASRISASSPSAASVGTR